MVIKMFHKSRGINYQLSTINWKKCYTFPEPRQFHQKIGHHEGNHMSSSQVIIGTYPEATAAHLARLRLDAAGIKSWLVDENIASAYPFYTQVIGGVKLAVREDDALAASSVIQGLDAAEQARYQQNLHQCPMCGSKNVGENAMRFLWLLLLTFMTCGLYLQLCYRRHKCKDCGSVW